MTHNVSRRNLAKGAAWAAPAVVATTAIPAYAASPTCPPAADIKARVDQAFKAYALSLPNSVQNFKFYFIGSSSQNGAAGTGALRTIYSGQASDLAQYPLQFEFGLRNVDTSAAVNSDSISGKTIQNRQIPAPYSPAGGTEANNAYSVSTCEAIRSGSYRSSFVKFYDDATRTSLRNSLSHGNGEMTCRGSYWSVDAIINPDTTYYQDQLASGNPQDLINMEILSGAAGSRGRVYSGYGFRTRGWAAPSLDQVVTAIGDPKYTAQCILAAYTARTELWYATPEESQRGLNITFLGWSPNNGGGVGTPLTAGDWVWSDEIGNYHSGYAGEAGGAGLANSVKWSTRGTWANMEAWLSDAVWPTGIYGELEYRDGVY
ncbi:MAG: hypothetical protein Q4A03_02105 [Rothia sp. (in: high G+C Gram-positive bacteria)]|uniref:hypothetical protein n=1 Tax=Rothia sp. (in: high G+C Gram-positive bacteria) TaxID=1885016 RepID=UPI00270DCF1E|nr:hypothetical protein [Rothia sp. (in: high G+C Gram-positive bacteria)]